MSPERWQQIVRIFDEVLEQEPVQRAAFLDEACAGDEGLRREVASLIAARDCVGDFLQPEALTSAARELLTAQPTLSTGQQIAHFEVLTPLGAGGMGEVYLARDLRLERKVALKLLPARFTLDAGRLRRFEREARAASSLNHPYIITVYEVGVERAQDGDRHFIATEFVEGVTLRQRLNSGPLALNEALDIAIGVAAALAAAHASGIVHRDIKPENVMVRHDGVVKVLDFGIAKLTENSASDGNGIDIPSVHYSTDPGTVMGTARYMSPEQARGQKVDARSDIFSLGVVLYELITSKAPFEGGSAFEVIAAILERKPLPFSQQRVEVPAELERIVSRALEKDREMRHQSASDLRAELKRLQRELDSGSMAAARGERLPTALRAGWRNWRMKAALTLGGLTVLLVVWFWPLRYGDRLKAVLYGATNQRERSTAQIGKASGAQPSAGTGKLVGVRWSDEKYLFFRGREYYRYDVKADRIDFEHPRPIAGNWQGIWAEGVDAIILSPWDNGKAFFFKGGEYIQYDIVADKKPDVGYPKPIADGWPGIWPDGIDAAVVWNNGKIYFFKGDEYIRFDIQSKRPDPGYPSPIAGSWPEVWSSNFDTVFTNHLRPLGGNKVYFFKDGQYIRYDMKLNQKDPDYPRAISRNWIGLP